MSPPISCLIRLPTSNRSEEQVTAAAYPLLNLLQQVGLAPRETKSPYVLLEADSATAVCTLYRSGKMVLAGKRAEGLYTYLLQKEAIWPAVAPPATSSSSNTSSNILTNDPLASVAHMGSDESGKGDYFGPLCVAAVAATPQQIAEMVSWGVRDSKALNDQQVLQLADKIAATLPHQVQALSVEEYNHLYAQFNNLNHLLAYLHAHTIYPLSLRATECVDVLVDQFATGPCMAQALAKLDAVKRLRLHQRTQGESDPVVAAASILARATFVRKLAALSDALGITLPKGCSSGVRAVGIQIYRKGGIALLGKVGKLHFKTTLEIQEANEE